MKKILLFLSAVLLFVSCDKDEPTPPQEPENPEQPEQPVTPEEPSKPEPTAYKLTLGEFEGGEVYINGKQLIGADTILDKSSKVYLQFIPDADHIFTGSNILKGCAARDSFTISKDTTLTPVFELISKGTYSDIHKICNYNIRYYNGSGNSAIHWPNRKEKVFEMIRRHEMDVCGIEEITKYQSPDFISTLTEYEYVGYGRDNGKENSAGASGEQTGIIYKKDRYVKMDQGRFFLSKTPYKVSKVSNSDFNRLVAWVKLKDRTSGKEFFFFSTHFNHNYTAVKVQVRTDQAEIAINEVPKIAGDLPYFFAGDFNCEITEPAYEMLSTRWTDAFIAMGDNAIGAYVCNEEQQTLYPTQCAWEGNTYTGLYSSDDKSPKRIDLVLFDSSRATISSYFADNDDMGLEKYPSDHLPVITEMTIK
jgi:endonuclease/exonuclease/phosphatase family metal-dependent hydrolase